MNEQKKYDEIKRLIDADGNKKRVAVSLGCSVRHINRMIKGYKTQGKAFFIHGNKGRLPSHAVAPEKKALILDLYRNKYYDANYTHFAELLQTHENLCVSTSVIRSALMPEYVLSPRAKRSTRKNVKAILKEELKTTKSKRECGRIHDTIVAIEDAHPRRPRCANFGEMIQMDASIHHWFGAAKAHLHIAVDDSTGAIVGAYFDNQETLKGYYNVFHQILTNYGIPYMFFTDRRTVFEYKQKKSPSLEDDTFTQFGYACKQLGVVIKTSSVPQAKGRVERMFQTLQSRLPIELRLAGATTLAQANEFLNHYIKKFNAMFALTIDNTKSVFEKQPSDDKINLILAVLANRKVDCGHSVKFNRKYFRLLDSEGLPVYHYKGTSGIVIQSFCEELFFCVGDKVYALEEIPAHELTSKNFDFIKPQHEPKKQYIPPMNHPWRQFELGKFVKSQAHRVNLSA